MPLVHMSDMLRHAYENRYAVAAFDVVSLDFITGILDAAEAQQAPVILSLAESHFKYFSFDLLMSAVVKAARETTVPVAIHLDHGESMASAVTGINRGCTGVMVDASGLPLEENIRRTRAVVEMAHACGVPVEGELGYVPGVEGEDAERHPGEVIYTTATEAKTYLDETGVDFLAVSIGTVHGRMKGQPKLDFDRLAEINRSLRIPLVIHGGTGLSDDQYRRLIDNGVTKITSGAFTTTGKCQQGRRPPSRDGGCAVLGPASSTRSPRRWARWRSLPRTWAILTTSRGPASTPSRKPSATRG